MSVEQATNPFNDFVFLNATPADRGSFTLATDKALEKLERFQLPDPTFFVLQWIQALVASEATEISIVFDHNRRQNRYTLEIEFDGPGYTRQEIQNLYDHVFRSSRNRAIDRLRELALGWLSACSLTPEEIVLESNGYQRVREGRQERTLALPETTQKDVRHNLRMSGQGAHPIDEIIKGQCHEVPCVLRLNGELVGSVQGGNVPWPNRKFQSGPTQGVMGATYGGSGSSYLTFLRYGVECVSRTEDSLQPPIHLRVSDSTLSKNVSQTDLVRDEAYEEFLSRVRTEMKHMGLELTNKRIPSYQRDSLNRFIQSYLASYIDVRVFSDSERLQTLGEEFENLITFPLFRASITGYLSLAELQAIYAENGYLVYIMDREGMSVKWDGTLLILEPEEVAILKKYFANLIGLSLDQVRAISRGWSSEDLSKASIPRPVCTVKHRPNPNLSNEKPLTIELPDTYPTGEIIIERGKSRQPVNLPGIDLTLSIKVPTSEFTSGDLAQLRNSLEQPVRELLNRLCHKLNNQDKFKEHSLPRYAELCSEILLYLFEHGTVQDPEKTVLDELSDNVRRAPIIGLEDGSLASIDDLLTYVKIAGKVYWGGVFIEGLKSGALDPMPKADKLVSKLLSDHQIIDTQTVRDRMDSDPTISFQLRRQTLMRGLANHPSPEQALTNFANEAAAEAEMIRKMEAEYKDALKGPKLFVAPDKTRLEELASAGDDDDFSPFDLGELDDGDDHPDRPPSGSGSDSATQKLDNVPMPLPTIESDLERLRHQLGDLCSAHNGVRVERREALFNLHICTVWGPATEGSIKVLCGEVMTSLTHPLPIEGFIRVSPSSTLDPSQLLEDAVEQQVLRALNLYKSVPKTLRDRHRLRDWLLECCAHLPKWSQGNRAIANDLFRLPIVTCLGNRNLSWQQLLAQAQGLGRTLIARPETRPDNSVAASELGAVNVIDVEAPWLGEVLELLGFPEPLAWEPVKRNLDFDVFLNDAWKEITTVLSGRHDNLITLDLIGQLANATNFWSRWRSGFLSWDEETRRAMVNPNHKIGKQLFERYHDDAAWRGVFASALFSTINRGLIEVEDYHEKIFLEGLLDTLA